MCHKEVFNCKNQSKNGFLTRNHTKKNKEDETCPVKIDRVEAEIQAYTLTHIHTQHTLEYYSIT